MKIALLAVLALLPAFGFADDDGDEFLGNQTAKGEARSAVAKTAAKGDEAEPVRKCYKCLGKGTMTENVRENCVRCDGTGYVEVEVEVKDTVNGRYYWESNYRVRRKVVAKKPCAHCGHRGKLPVKKVVPCKKCTGTGYLTKSGKPASCPTDEKTSPDSDAESRAGSNDIPQFDSDGEEKSSFGFASSSGQKSLASRIRAKSQVQVGPMEIESKTGRGWAEFNFRSNGGRFTIRGKGTEFSILWLPGSERMVRVSRSGLEAVGYKPNVRFIPSDQDELESFDWSRPLVDVDEGCVVGLMNKEGRFAVIKVKNVQDRKFGADDDLLYIEFVIY